MLGKIALRDLSLAARMRIEDAARTLARALACAKEPRDPEPPRSSSLEDLRGALASAMRKLAREGDAELLGFRERLAFLAVTREALSWARTLHPPEVALEIERLRDVAVDPADPAGRALAALEADLGEARETTITWTKEADAMR